MIPLKAVTGLFSEIESIDTLFEPSTCIVFNIA